MWNNSFRQWTTGSTAWSFLSEGTQTRWVPPWSPLFTAHREFLGCNEERKPKQSLAFLLSWGGRVDYWRRATKVAGICSAQNLNEKSCTETCPDTGWGFLCSFIWVLTSSHRRGNYWGRENPCPHPHGKPHKTQGIKQSTYSLIVGKNSS